MPLKAPCPRARRYRLIALACLLCATPAAQHLPPSARAASTLTRPAQACEGDACTAVSLTWEEEGQRYRVANSSERRVRVEVETYAGKSSVTVEPQDAAYLQVKNFNGPYRAAYE